MRRRWRFFDRAVNFSMVLRGVVVSFMLLLLLNVSFLDCSHPYHITTTTRSILPRGAALSFAKSVPDYLRSAPFNASALSACDHVIVVCGHAITVVEALDEVDSSDLSWSLLPYQREQDLPASFVSHIERGVQIAAGDPKSLLVFSGGQTRSTAGPRSEAMSYWLVAEHFAWWGGAAQARPRAVVEDYARDSFENLLFSLCRFKEVTGHYPTRVTVVGYAFKGFRFESLHRVALGLQAAHFSYVGLQPPSNSKFDLAKAEAGEQANAVALFAADPYGCSDLGLVAKRMDRNPYKRAVPYGLSCPELGGLLAWCGPGVYDGSLPWDQ
eukprot:CAMPEP_0171919294 /NCGR_PEP_ID=MMETSP0993-20121228/17966_1 /TAXON_ID=483369 /ORGANISM="non described non described, Strain CCMP2098" /LENGTH=325 /DNA_ID=CAMNT_0012555895 /DNA_START=128 /DNA_END=1105 /DNA_ORIENTATION=-